MEESGPGGEESRPGPRPPATDRAGQSDEQESAPLTNLELLRRVTVGLLEAVENAAELVGATLREESARFQAGLQRRLVAVFLLAAGLGLVTAGAALLLSKVMAGWAVFLLLGALYVGGGLWLLRERRPAEEREGGRS